MSALQWKCDHRPPIPDRDLLEKAAMAAAQNWRDWTPTVFAGEGGLREWPYEWNPLVNDGDALRLAVRLKLSVEHFPHADEVSVRGRTAPDKSGQSNMTWEFMCTNTAVGGDLLAATRRAIVRAAVATLGEGA